MYILNRNQISNSLRSDSRYTLIPKAVYPLLAFSICLLWTRQSGFADDIPEIVVPAQQDFHIVVDGLLWEDADFSGKEKLSFPGKTDIKAIVLGQKNSFGWLEQTPTGKVRSFREDTPGLRLMALTFGGRIDNGIAIEPVTGFVADGVIVRNTASPVWNRQIEFQYWYKDIRPARGKTLVYSATNRSGARAFSKSAKLDNNLKNDANWHQPKVEDGGLVIFQSGLKKSESIDVDQRSIMELERKYTIKPNESGKCVIAAHCNYSFGQFRVEFNNEIELDQLSSEDQRRMRQFLQPVKKTAEEQRSIQQDNTNLSTDDEKQPRVVANDSVFCCWWQGDVDRALVISIDKLDRYFYAQLVELIQNELNEYDYKNRDFKAATKILGKLTMADTFVKAIKSELGNQKETESTTSILNCSEAIEGLVFRLPVTVAEGQFNLFYNLRTKKAVLLPQTITWSPIQKPLQFKVDSRPTVWAMFLKPEQKVQFSAEKLDEIKNELVKRYEFSRLADATLLAGFPANFVPEISWDQFEKEKRDSIKFLTNFKTSKGNWAVKMSVETDAILDTRLLYFGKSGLPVTLHIEQFFLGKRDRDNGAEIRTNIVAKDFQIVSNADDFIELTVVVDEAIIEQADGDQCTVRVRYPGEEREFKVKLKNGQDVAPLKMPRATNEGETVLDLEYWSEEKKSWILAESAAEGILVVNQ